MDEISQPYARELARQVDELETENERLRSVLRECLADYSHPNFTDRRGQDLEAALRSLRRAHYVCEDCWYSCPKSGECCRDDLDYCTCGADEANAIIDQALKTEKARAMSKHTPGPWFATTRQGSWDYVVASSADPNIEICQMFHDGTEGNELGEANARLVAAAPALRAALAEIARHYDNQDMSHRDFRVIAKQLADEALERI